MLPPYSVMKLMEIFEDDGISTKYDAMELENVAWNSYCESVVFGWKVDNVDYRVRHMNCRGCLSA